MTLQFADGEVFCQGACRYLAKPAATGDSYIRPFLSIAVEGQTIEVAVDTGGFFLILHPEIAELIGLLPENGEPLDALIIRGQRSPGHLHRTTMTLEAQRGDTFDVEVTALVPTGNWDYPNFLRWPFCLERLRFAFEPDVYDPAIGWFHFGALDMAQTEERLNPHGGEKADVEKSKSNPVTPPPTP